jgi:hypothetical protein
MLLPRPIDLCLGAVFLLVDTAAYICSYYMILDQDDDPHTKHSHMMFVLFGYIQSLIGFIAGLWLARITQIDAPIVLSDEEETMTLITKE